MRLCNQNVIWKDHCQFGLKLCASFSDFLLHRMKWFTEHTFPDQNHNDLFNIMLSTWPMLLTDDLNAPKQIK